MLAAGCGYPHVVRILLNEGAKVTMVANSGYTALHFTAQAGHLAVIELLVKAGVDLEAKSSAGSTSLHLATKRGHSEVMRVLIEADANPNSRLPSGSTPLYMAAQHRQVGAAMVLLRAKANPLLGYSSPSGETCVPLDIASRKGHLDMARELIQQHGIEGCGGASGGVLALKLAAQHQHVEIMGMLTSAGVVDTGVALRAAALCGRESSVKFLLQHQDREARGEGAGYLDTLSPSGATPLVCSIQGCCRSCSPRITRLLVDAGADTTTAVRLTHKESGVVFDDTPLALADVYLSAEKTDGKDATEEQLRSLEATRRLLMRVEAVHAVSWLWAGDVPSVTHAAAGGTDRATQANSTPLISMLPVLRRRARRPRVLLAALFRWVVA